jgi:hypothetical protein
MSSVPVEVPSVARGEELDASSATSEARRLASLAPRPIALAATGLSRTFLADLLAKHLATAGVLTTSQLIERLALAGPIIDEVLNFMRAEARVEVRSRVAQEAELRYGLTDLGRKEAADALNRSGYVGPAPVPLDDYSTLVSKQSVHGQVVTRQAVLETFRGFVIDEDLRDRLGPALNSRRAMFLYGRAGTGKTYTARRLSRALKGFVLVPHAISVNESVIEIFDPLCHEQAKINDAPSPTKLEEGFDPRYLPCQRPIVLTGGELAADMLEVQADVATRTYSAPIQMKANNGFLLIDDLGRQRIPPAVLFNRWIVPLDAGHDSLTTGKGHHFVVPFDLVLVFSTNLRPQDIADEAFLRRLGYKIEFTPIAPALYERIWRDVCVERSVAFDPRLVEFTIRQLHGTSSIPMLPCHPRDLIGMALDRVAYTGIGKLDEDTIRWAWDSYFLHKGANEFEGALLSKGSRTNDQS